MDPSQQMNSKLWQRHRASTETPFFHDNRVIPPDDQYVKSKVFKMGQNPLFCWVSLHAIRTIPPHAFFCLAKIIKIHFLGILLIRISVTTSVTKKHH